ncbi:hypothetical protein niasHT_003550 [Heterodera trifolii]|uniref:BTB domain-containing protein n=1 Tax=Heterodera trifolii TaxID=157864 RepID=A0ABD2LT48_9BILA
MSDVDTLADRMKRLLSTGVDADVHALFEENEPIEMPDVDIEAFKTMLTFIYTDDLSGVNGDNAIDVLYAVKKYNLPTLVKACVGIPVAKLENVFIAFAKARLLIEKALRWADVQCAQNGKECFGTHRREMLGMALYKIRFPIIHKDYFNISKQAKNMLPQSRFNIQTGVCLRVSAALKRFALLELRYLGLVLGSLRQPTCTWFHSSDKPTHCSDVKQWKPEVP